MQKRVLLLLAGLLFEAVHVPLGAHPATTSPSPTFSSGPPRAATKLAFEKNLGQADAQVKFIARSRSYSLFLTDHDAVIARAGDSVRMTFVGSKAPRLSALDELPGTVNYLIGDQSRWHTGIKSYGRIRYDELYPGIDLVFYGDDRQLEYDLVVEPGADPRTIRLALTGTRALTTADDGSLIARTDASTLRLRPPTVYQSAHGEQARAVIPGRYRIVDEKTVAFEVDAYDRTRPLIIDPQVVYSTLLGGDGNDDPQWGGAGSIVAVDATGAAYVTGFTDSSNFPTTAGALQPLHIVSYSATDGREPCTNQQIAPRLIGGYAFVSKLSPDGSSLVYSTYLGGSYQIDGRTRQCNGPVNYGTGIAINDSGNAFVTGYTDTADFPLSGGNNTPSMFVAKLNATGTGVLYVARVRSFNGDTTSTGIAVGTDGSAYVTGFTLDFNFPATPGAFQTECRACNFSVFRAGDAFALKVNPSGVVAWATFLGASGNSAARGIAVDATGQPVIVGGTNTGADALYPFPTTPGAFQTTAGTDGGLRGGSDVFVTKFDASGSALVFSTLLRGNQADIAGGIAVDGDGSVYVTGGTSSNEFPTTPGAFRQTFPGGRHAFVTKLWAGGNVAYSTFLGAASARAGDERGFGIAVDGVGRAFVTGNTDADDFPMVDALEGPDQLFPGQGSVFLSVLNSSGSELDFSTYLGRHAFAIAQSVALGPLGSAYVAGRVDNRPDCCPFPTTDGAFQTQAEHGIDFLTDAFVIRVQVAAILPPNCAPATASLASLWPANHRMVLVGVTGVTDPLGLATTIKITGIQQDEPTDGLGDGDTPIDGAGVDSAQASVRAERSGTGNGRVYTILFSATNTSGASCTGTVRVGVPHDQGGGRVAVDSGVRYDSTVAGGPPLP